MQKLLKLLEKSKISKMANQIKKKDWFDGVVKYLTAAFILVIPLYPKFPFIRVPGTFVSIRLEDLLVVFLGLIILLTFLSRPQDFFKGKINKAIMIYLSVGLVSAVSAVFLTKTAAPHLAFLHWARRIEYLVPFFFGIIAVGSSKDNLKFYFKVLLLVIVISFIYGFGQKHFNWPIIVTQNQEYAKGVALRWIPGSHVNSTFAGHYDLATFLVMTLPMVAGALFFLKGKRTKIVLGAIFFAGLWLLVNAVSRISIASYLGSLTLVLFLLKKYKAIPVMVIVSLVFIGMSSNLLARYTRVFEHFRLKLMENGQKIMYEVNSPVYAQDETISQRKVEDPTPTPVPPFEDRSTSIRLNVEWPRAIRALKKNPLLGTGYSSITLATDNDYLRLLGETGLLGFFAFGLIFVRIFEKFLKAMPFDKKFSDIEFVFAAGVVGAMPGIFLNAVFIDIFEASKFAMMFWLMVGFTIGLINIKLSE